MKLTTNTNKPAVSKKVQLYKDIAEDRFAIYQSFLEAGFDQDQAFQMTRDMNNAYVQAMMEAASYEE